MKIIYDVSDIDGNHHGRFDSLKEAKECALRIARHIQKDTYIEETKEEIIEWITPN